MFSRVWSKSFLAVATIGTFVVCKSRRASSRPMPRDAGLTSAHGCMVTVSDLFVCRTHYGIKGRSKSMGIETTLCQCSCSNDDGFGRSAQIGFRTDMVRAEHFHERWTLPRGRAIFPHAYLSKQLSVLFHHQHAMMASSDLTLLVWEAKVATKRATLKGVPMYTCDLSLNEVGAAARKPIMASRTRARWKHDENKHSCKYCETCYSYIDL